MKNKKICLVLMILCFILPIFSVFPVVKGDPEDNFYAISKSNNTTQWILQGNETLEEEVFHDDILNESWDLYGTLERYFLKTEEQANNYLLDNYSTGSGYEWMYIDERYYTDISIRWDAIQQYYDQISLCWDGKNWYIANGAVVYKFSENWGWIYHDSFFNIRQYTLTIQPNRDIRAIEWNGTSYFVLFSNNLLWEYKSIFVKYPTPTPSPINKFYLPFGNIHDIFWDGTYWWALRVYNPTPNTIRLMGVYKFFSNWTYTGMWYNLEEIDEIIGTQQKNVISYRLEQDGLNWWIGDADYISSYVYKMYSNFTYTGIRYHRATFDFVLKDSFFLGLENEYIYKYCSEDSIVYNISKNYQGNGYTYVQTDKSKEVGLISSTYDSNCSLSSGDYFEVDFETNSNSEIKLELISGGLKVKELVLNSGQIFLDENVEFDQIRFTSLFTDQDYLKIFDIKCYNVSTIVHYAEFYVDPFQSYSIFLTPTTYNLKILEGGKIKVDENIYIESPSIPYYYTFYSPIIIINSPHSNELFGNNPPSFNIEIKNNNGIDKMWYTLDNGLTNTTFTTNGTINQDLWDSLSNGTVIISFYVKDSIGNIGNNSIMLRVDKIGPFVKINSPLSNELFESTSPGFNVEISDANLDRMWYNINGEPKKNFFLTNGSLDLTAWASLPDGIVTIQFYANDTLGNIGSSEVAIRKDVNVPIIVITSPENNNVIGSLAPNFGIFIDEPNLENTWYSLNNGNNITFTGSSGIINQALWDTLLEGSITIRFYANDSAGNIGFSEVSIKKDISVPTIVFNDLYNSEIFGALAPNFNISIEEPNLDKMWYSLNGGNNVTFTGLIGIINQALWNSLPEGSITIRFYANDTAGNIGFQEVTVVKTISQPPPPGIPGYNILFLLGIVSTVAVIIVKKRLNHLN